MRVPWYAHNVVYRYMEMRLVYKAFSPIRIGAGKTGKLYSPIDLPVITIRMGDDDVPYIPGSSLKGVFRSAAENIARSSGFNDICSMGEGCKSRYESRLKDSLKANEVSDVYKILSEYCLVCKAFGSATYRSHIDFLDAYPVSDVSRGVKVGIAIDRRSGTVKKKRGGPYIVEYVGPGTEFYGGITLHNIPNYMVGLLKGIIDMINVGLIKIGGMKTRGFGRVEIKIEGIDGYIFRDGEMIALKDVREVPPIDIEDGPAEFDPKDPGVFLGSCLREWRRYVESSKG